MSCRSVNYCFVASMPQYSCQIPFALLDTSLLHEVCAYVLSHTASQLWFCWHGDSWASSGWKLDFSMFLRALQMHVWRKSCSKRQYDCMWHGGPFYPSLSITRNQAMSSDFVHCSMRWILLLLEELNNKSCAVHMSSRMVTHMREI